MELRRKEYANGGVVRPEHEAKKSAREEDIFAFRPPTPLHQPQPHLLAIQEQISYQNQDAVEGLMPGTGIDGFLGDFQHQPPGALVAPVVRAGVIALTVQPAVQAIAAFAVLLPVWRLHDGPNFERPAKAAMLALIPNTAELSFSVPMRRSLRSGTEKS